MRNYLKSFRTERRLTQDEVAVALGISESYYNLIENGSRQKDMDLNIIDGLAKVFDVEISQIIEQEQLLKS